MKPFLLLLCLLLSGAARAQTKVTVRVVDAKKAPVAGANVEVQLWRNRLIPVPAQITGTDGTATVELSAAPGDKPDGKLNGVVSVVAPGFAFNNAVLTGKDLEVQLDAGATWHGTVKDEAGMPVEGAVVRVSGAMEGNDWQHRLALYGAKSIAAYTTKSGADGNFAIKDVPAKMGLQWSIERPGYAIQGGVGALADAAIAIKLLPGGSLRGRIVDLAGAPLANVLVYASIARYASGNSGKSGADGGFTIESLAPGTYSIGAYFDEAQKDSGFALPRVAGVTVEAGKMAEAPPIRAVVGFKITGLVRDAATQKPLTNASIYAQNGEDNRGSAQTDATGRFTLRVTDPGLYKLNISGVPEGYKRPEEQKSVTVGAAAPENGVATPQNGAGEVAAPDVNFDLKRAVALRGTLVDEAGKPLQAQLKVDYDTTIKSDAEGKWQFEPQSERALQLGGGDAEDGYFEVVSPTSIAADKTTETTVVLRKNPWQVLPGRALSSDGTPLEGVQVEGEFYTSVGEGGSLQSSRRTARSNANGDFIVPQIRDGIQANSNYFKVSGKKDGYAFQKGGVLSKNGPVWQVSDLVFVPLNLKVAGQTAPGARVTAAGQEIVASADGNFKFDGLPAGEARVWAFEGDRFGGAAAQTPAAIELKIQGIQERDLDLAHDIWSDLVTDAQRGTKGNGYYQLASVQRRLEAKDKPDYTAQLEKANGDNDLMRLSQQLGGKADPAALTAAFARIKNPAMRAYAFLSAALKSSDKTFAARALQETANAAPDAKAGGDDWMHEITLYLAAAVAAKFGDEASAFKQLDGAVAFTLTHHGAKSTGVNGRNNQAGQGEMMAMAAETVAEGGPALLDRLLQNIEPGEGWDASALGKAIPVIAKNGGAEAALPLLARLETLPEPENRGENRRSDLSPQWAFADAASKVVALLGAKSPDAALQLARRVRDENYGNDKKWRALSDAAKFQNGEAAAKLWREIVSGARGEMASRYAARAFNSDPKLGRELFGIARQKVEEQAKQGWQRDQLWAGYAFYSARSNAAQARFLIEREWGLARQKMTEGDELGALALAMAAIDAPRAWQMAREIPADNQNASLEARRKIGLYLAAAEATRRDFPFGNQNWDEWRALDGDD